MVQEPSLTLLERAGGRVLVNFMKLDDATRWLGGPYQFLSLSARPETLESQGDIAKGLIKGLVLGNRWVLASPGSEIVKAMPEELVAGGDIDTFANALDRFKADLYPNDGRLNADSVQRVIQVQQQFGAIEPGTVDSNRIFSNTYVEQAIAGLPRFDPSPLAGEGWGGG